MNKRLLTVGKWRGLSRCASASGVFSVLALDHRNNLRRILSPEAPDGVSFDDLSTFKQRVVEALGPASTAVLLDPEFGAAQCIAAGALSPAVGLVVALEATGYGGESVARSSQVLEGWSAEKARRMGADAVKLLVYYHPDAPTAGEIETLVQETSEVCSRLDLALVVEPLSYSLKPGARLEGGERRRVVVETARRLTGPGVDLLKAEFPCLPESDPADWRAACAEVSRASPVPWVVLSAGVDFETYVRQVTAACEAGASGVAAGRAVWKELVDLPEERRAVFLAGPALLRTRRLTSICDGLARPFTEVLRPGPCREGWYLDY